MISKHNIFNLSTIEAFNTLALKIFKFQFEHNAVYRSFCDLLFIHPSSIKHYKYIPFLPISFFKTHKVLTGSTPVEKIFESSGTTVYKTAKHYLTDLSLYRLSFFKGFEYFFGNIEEYVVLALLPSYLERKNASLVYMAADLIKKSNNPLSGFYLDNYAKLKETLKKLELSKQKTLLIGVSFALLDLIEHSKFNLKHTLIMETGGMKGRRKEMIRAELHEALKAGFGVSKIYSEYGMTELLSQAYSFGNGIFKCPPWMKVLIREPQDNLNLLGHGKTGGINIIDLANINSCSFIATQDLGKTHKNQTFEVLGRFDYSDLRGCNLMLL